MGRDQIDRCWTWWNGSLWISWFGAMLAASLVPSIAVTLLMIWVAVMPAAGFISKPCITYQASTGIAGFGRTREVASTIALRKPVPRHVLPAGMTATP